MIIYYDNDNDLTILILKLQCALALGILSVKVSKTYLQYINLILKY